jgi:hypothetical protein
MDNIEIITDNDIKLAEHAAVIRALGRRVVGDVIEIGRRLNDAQALCKEHGNLWLPWLKREFGWTESSAKRFMQVANKTPNLGDVDVPISGLYLLAQDSTPPTVIEAIAASISRRGVDADAPASTANRQIRPIQRRLESC